MTTSRSPSGRKRPLRLIARIGWSIVLLGVLGYGAVGMWFVINEGRLIYHPSRLVEQPNLAPGLKYDRVELRSKDNTRLVGWSMRTAEGDSSGAWVLYFHGNAGNIADCVDRYRLFEKLGINVFAGDYRGYGESEGRPDEPGLYLDAEAMYNYLVDVLRVPPHRIILYGHSLGSGVATELAMRREAACLVLEGAFQSMADREGELYPYLPIKLFTRNRFDSMSKIGLLNLPKLIVHAVDDTVISIDHGRALFDAAAPPKTFLILQGGHGGAVFTDEEKYLGGMRTFLGGLSIISLRQQPIPPGSVPRR